MPAFAHDDRFVDPDEVRQPNVAAVLLVDLGVHELPLSEQQRAVEAWLDTHEPSPALAASLRRAGLPSRPAPASDAVGSITAAGDEAVGLWSSGDRTEALRRQEAVVEDARRLLGPDHPETIGAVGNLAVFHAGVGAVGRALALAEDAYESSRRILGDDHPDTARSGGNLAVVYERAGRIAEVVDLERSVLETLRARLGPDHRDSLTAASNLAIVYRRIGEHVAAAGLEDDVLRRCERSLGPAHPETIAARRRVARQVDVAWRVDADVGSSSDERSRLS